MAEGNADAPKILGIVCSLRGNGNSEILLDRALRSARELGGETDLLRLAGASIAPCDGCYGCLKSGVCLIKDDMQEWLPKFERADAMIFATPVFFWSLPGATKVLMDRLYPLYRLGKLTNKVGAVIAVASSVGHTGLWQVFSNFFSAPHMLAADLVYAYGRDKGDVRRDRHAMKASSELGKQVVELCRSGFRYPASYPRTLYLQVRDEFGIDMSPAKGRFEERGTESI